MYQKTYSTALTGLTGLRLEIECHISGGLPSFTIIGMSPSTASAAREKVRSALKSCGFSLPASRITVNVRSMDARFTDNIDRAPWLDLPIALCILGAQRLIPPSALERTVWMGEFSLAGNIKPLYGALTMARCLSEKAPSGEVTQVPLFLPEENASEAALCPGVAAYGIAHLSEVVEILRSQKSPRRIPPLTFAPPKPQSSLFDEVSGQGVAKRAITLSAAGMHNLLLIGPPGCGKTMLVSALPSLLPPLSYQEQLELTEIYSCRQLLQKDGALLTSRPFRAPHHSISTPALLGGGAYPTPGEATLAHHGVLFLDEFPEISRTSLEALREPLEDHTVRVSRVHGTYTFPADFVLAAGMNPCPCGYYPDKAKCRCSERQVKEYLSHIDSPILDRMDLVLHMENVKAREIGHAAGLSFVRAREMVDRAIDAQQKRFGRSGFFNSRMDTEMIRAFCPLSREDSDFLKGACEHFGLSMRAYHKILRLSRTIADVEGCEAICRSHLLEAMQYRTDLR